jgi:hypothetical protein
MRAPNQRHCINPERNAEKIADAAGTRGGSSRDADLEEWALARKAVLAFDRAAAS